MNTNTCTDTENMRPSTNIFFKYKYEDKFYNTLSIMILNTN